MGNLKADLRYALRVARQNRSSTLAAMLALALGIGATVAMFSIVSGVLLKPLPVPHADRFVQIFETEPELTHAPVNVEDYLDWKGQLKSFENMAAVSSWGQATYMRKSSPERVRPVEAEASLLPLLGVSPIRGRNFTEEENQPGRGHVALLSWAFWKNHLGGDEQVLGQKIALDAVPYTVVGILPANVPFLDDLLGKREVWIPLPLDRALPDNQRGNHGRMVYAKLRPGVPLTTANAELRGVAAALAKQYPRENAGVGAFSIFVKDRLTGNIRSALFILFGAVSCVLLIVCGNVANLLLARAASRRREISVRLALGASRGRLVRQLLTESVLLSVIAVAVGVGLAEAAVRLVRSLPFTGIPRPGEIAIDWRALLFAVGVGIATGLIFGLAPALRASGVTLNETLKQAGGRTTETRSQQRLRRSLVTLETALATLLLVGSGLLIRSFLRVSGIDPGFNPDGLLTMQLVLPEARYAKPGMPTQFLNQVLPAIQGIPGVRSAALTSKLPLLGGNNGTIVVEGRTESKLFDSPLVEFSRVSPGYFGTMGIARMAGRDFNAHDRKESPAVVVVNQALARQFFPNADPLGKRIAYFDPQPRWMQIVGIVADVRQWGIEQKAIPEMYTPLAQDERLGIAVVIRTAGDPRAIANVASNAIRAVDREQSIFGVETMQQIINEDMGLRTFQTSLLTAFAAIALILAAFGTYAVIAYSVVQRRPEIGIRMALGAARTDMTWMIVRQGVMPALIGAVGGALISLGAARVLAKLLYGVHSDDALTYLS